MSSPYDPPPPGSEPPPSGGQPPQGQPPYGQPQYGQPPSGQPPYGQPPYGQQPPPYGQPPYGQPHYGYPPAAPAGTNGFAIASLVCAFFCSPLGLIFGFVARNQIKRTGQQGEGLAMAGIITRAVLLVVGIIWTIFVLNTADHIANNPYGLAPAIVR